MNRQIFVGLTALAMLLGNLGRAQAPTSAPAGQLDAANATEFKHIVAQLLERRSAATENTGDEAARLQESALQILDGFVVEILNAPGQPQLEALNRRLGELVEQPAPAGQGYSLLPLGGAPAVYVLTANFGSSGPSAVRLYARGKDQYQMAARIDVVAEPDYFDDHLIVLPISASSKIADVVFVTVTGRTDEYLTGVFAAWRFEGDHVAELWATDLMPQSKYEMRPDGIEITFCAEADENPESCRRVARERYAWDGSAWKRVEQTDLGPPQS